MPAPKIAQYPALFQPGIVAYSLVPSMVDYFNPTRAELNSGLDITRQTRDSPEGFSLKADQVERKDMSVDFVPKIGGRKQADDSSVWVYATRSGQDIRQSQPFGWTGYFVIFDGGDVAGYLMDIYPVLVIGRPKQRSDSDPLGIQIQYSITLAPAEDRVIPA